MPDLLDQISSPGEIPTSIGNMTPEELLRMLREAQKRAARPLPLTATQQREEEWRALAEGTHALPHEERTNEQFAQDVLKSLARSAQQFGAGAVELAGRVPWEVLSAPVAGAEFLGNVTGLEKGYPLTQATQERAQRGTQIAEQVTQAGEPQNAAERLMRYGPTSLTPFGRATVPTTLLTDLVRTIMDQGPSRPESALEPAQPAPSALPSPADTNESVSHTPRSAIQELLLGSAQAQEPEVSPESVVRAPAQDTTQIETVGGPQTVSNADMSTFGILGLATVGMMFAPSLARTVLRGRLRPLRTVANAAPGTLDPTTRGDLARTYDDVNAGVLRASKAAGMPLSEIARLERNFRLLTRAAAQGLGDAAVKLGRAETPFLTFRTRVPLAELNRLDTPTVSQYLHLRDTLDDFLAIQRLNPAAKNYGRTVIRGLTQPQVLQQINALEAANPELRAFGRAFRENTRSMRQFQATGEYATLSRAEMRRLNAEHAHEVPFQGGRNLDDPTHDRGSATVELSTALQSAIRARAENEAVGQFIDASNRETPGLFTRITQEQLTNNPQWERNTVTMYRRGKKELYTTNPLFAQVLNIDPYYFSSNAGQAFYNTKRWLEMTTTNFLAPWFAATSALRSWQIGKLTAPKGLRSPTAIGSLAAIPQQLGPRLAGAIAQSLDHGSGQWLSQVFGQNTVNDLSQRLGRAWTDSFAHLMEANGTIRGAILQQQVQQQLAHARSTIFGIRSTAAGRGVSNTLTSLGRAYMELLNAVHNAPAYNFARRNRGRLPSPELAAAARALTGDPRVGGQYATRRGPIRIEDSSHGAIGTALDDLVRAYGSVTEFGRLAIPWYNYTVQGIKAIGKAYLDNPIKFTARAWLYGLLPGAVGYLYNRALGPEYSQYQMNRRSNYNSQMNLYFGIPGRPPEDGIEIPVFHEMSIAHRMMEIALNHVFGDALMTPQEDWVNAAQTWLNVVAMPPMPPAIQAIAGQSGVILPQGVFGQNAYQRQTEPFDQTGTGLPANIELVIRAFGGGLADVLGAGYAAYTQTPEGVGAGIRNAITEAGRRVVTKTPIVRDVLDMHVPASSDTQLTQETFRKLDALDDLVTYFRKWTKEPGATSNARVPGEINTNPASKAGGAIVDSLLGPGLPPESAGLDQPEPTNPLYKMFMERVYAAFKQDKTQGFESLMRRFGDYSENIRRIRNVNAGNAVTWWEQMKERPLMLEQLRAAGVDPQDPVKVRNWLIKERQDVGAVILFTIRKVEAEMSQEAGRPIKLEDIAPYSGAGGAGEDTPWSSLMPSAPE